VKLFWVFLIICIVILFGPAMLKLLSYVFDYLGIFFKWSYKLISATGYKGVL